MECSICMNLLSEGPDTLSVNPSPPTKRRKTQTSEGTSASPESTTISTPCGHIFHRFCLKGWLNGTRGSCPTCRQRFTMRATHPLYLDFQQTEVKPSPVWTFPEEGTKCVQTSPITDSNPKASHTDKEHYDLHQRVLLLCEENESLNKKYEREKERADLNEALALSLQTNQKRGIDDNDNSTQASSMMSKTEAHCSKSQLSTFDGGRDSWFKTAFTSWWKKGYDSDSEEDEGSWW